ncbi:MULTISPECIES: hypothetical protein [Luteimonas]|uniref:hypothetical protein n=1 Tax=Luteimonas TaxID=83614 RepID=UPI0011804589|nr:MULTISPECIES: hypothetical protein [Luteimonas]
MHARSLVLSVLAAALLGALVWVAVVGRDDGRQAVASEESPAPVADDEGPGTIASTQRAPSALAADATSAPGAASAAAPGVRGRDPVEMPGAGETGVLPRAPATTLPAAGPRPLSTEGERRIADTIAYTRVHDIEFDDMQTLLEHDARDAVSADAIEGRIVEHMRVHGARYSGLEIAPPRCTDTLCSLNATALPGLTTDAAHADAQALFRGMYAEPWFRESLGDPTLMVTIRDGAVVYVSTFLREPPGG